MTILPYRVTLHGHDQNIVWLIAETLQMNRKKEQTHRLPRIARIPSESLVTGVALRDQAAEWRWIRHHAAAAQLTLVKFHHGKFFLFCSGLGLSHRYIDIQLNKFTLESLHLTRYISIKLSCSGITNPKHSSLVWTLKIICSAVIGKLLHFCQFLRTVYSKLLSYKVSLKHNSKQILQTTATQK